MTLMSDAAVDHTTLPDPQMQPPPKAHANRISAARAHVLIQETLAAEAPGLRMTGFVAESPAEEYPQNLHCYIEMPPNPRAGAHVSVLYVPDDDKLTEGKLIAGIRKAIKDAQAKEQERLDLPEVHKGQPDPKLVAEPHKATAVAQEQTAQAKIGRPDQNPDTAHRPEE